MTTVNNYDLYFWLGIKGCSICEKKNGSGKTCLECKNLVCAECFPLKNICLTCYISKDMILNDYWQERAKTLYEMDGKKYTEAEKLFSQNSANGVR